MAIKRRGIFGGWTLTGKHAKAFIEQAVNNSKPNPLAQATLERGMKMIPEFLATGKITIKLDDDISQEKYEVKKGTEWTVPVSGKYHVAFKDEDTAILTLKKGQTINLSKKEG